MLTTWQDALDTLYGLANWETRPPGTVHTFELDRIDALLADLGRPQAAWPAVHVGGTNGKGSTCVMVASALQASGYRVGLYTSPHLHTVRERIRVDGRPIAESEVLAWLNRHRQLLDGHGGLTTFECLTALAFDHFAARQVDVAVVEVGLGGRLDTTNVVGPAVSVLTPIGLDHTAVLGDTVRQIAEDKAGILRRAVPVVSAPQAPDAGTVIEAAAARLGSPLTVVGRDVTFSTSRQTPRGQRFEVAVGARPVPLRFSIDLGLIGAHQQVNAAVAVAALVALEDRGLPVVQAAIEDGLRLARWPARLEELSDDPPVVVDGAHNPQAVRAVVGALGARYPDRRWQLILGTSRGKDLDGMLDALLPATVEVVTARSSHPRAMPAAALAEAVRRRGWPAREAGSPAEALAMAIEAAGAGELVVATGSIFLAADMREAWAARGGMPMPPRDPPLPSPA